ncbi:MAG: preprotein translocase subunit SecE [Defluviitaleaceae bacterium]|nr:preprotein translocase subunit SecE [Defluviitaleaceae bacterium]
MALSDYKGEFKKITWPTKKELIKQSITVIITSTIFGIVIFGMDFALNWLITVFASFVLGF